MLCWLGTQPVMRKNSSASTAARSSSISVMARASFCWMLRRSGLPDASDRKSTRLNFQSPVHLVCRLLLEKKKKKQKKIKKKKKKKKKNKKKKKKKK